MMKDGSSLPAPDGLGAERARGGSGQSAGRGRDLLAGLRAGAAGRRAGGGGLAEVAPGLGRERAVHHQVLDGAVLDIELGDVVLERLQDVVAVPELAIIGDAFGDQLDREEVANENVARLDLQLGLRVLDDEDEATAGVARTVRNNHDVEAILEAVFGGDAVARQDDVESRQFCHVNSLWVNGGWTPLLRGRRFLPSKKAKSDTQAAFIIQLSKSMFRESLTTN